ncbi:MAG: iron-containing alcohol dehydrogenase [Kiritimatiellae bacterium]|nr:iron-containing alcohol dehydrogenase [Kiritimatiellia bacterium]MBQ8126683.1 iron-containing alcohol dehydrogenase [Kiritimatiellia bacterium]
MENQNLTIGKDAALKALAAFCNGKSHIVLVTDGAAYKLCGAEDFISASLRLCANMPAVTHLVVPNANPKVETVQALLNGIKGTVDGFIAVGGGTTIDTAKLLNLAVVSGQPVKELLTQKSAPDKLLPCLAFPTTAGTGAEATRFAVCYDGEMKYSIDFEVMRPSDVAIVPEFTATLPAYQKASTNFDAYAQAVESLWAKGATVESKEYANRALARMKEDNWPEASYWAGRAIDISRTTAAHAFSYYLTSHYGIPHGHAVYMVFEYICRNNNHPEYIKQVTGLKSLREFAKEKGVGWEAMVDDLFEHVNLKRLGNNPVDVKKGSFL